MQTVSARFHELASGSVIPLSVSALVSFTKARNHEIKWFTLDNSTLNGGDLLAAEDNNPTQVWDAYDWRDVTTRLVDSINVERSITFPYNVQSAIADISLNNFDGLFTFSDDGGSSEVSRYMLPKRPVRIFMGYKGVTNVPMFVGLSQNMPDYSDNGTIVKMTAVDFLSEIGDQGLRNALMMKDATTDQVIAAILKQYGMTDDQFKLDKGQNTIPFVQFKKGDSAGTALRQLVQAENGALWLDEQGMVRFTTRSGILGKTPVMVLNKSNIVSIKPSRSDGIINQVNITSDIRVVQDNQPVFQAENEGGWEKKPEEDNYRIGANRSLDVWLSLSDPVYETDPFTIGAKSNTSTIQVKDLSGADVTTNIKIAGALFQDSYKLTVTNLNSTSISISGIELWGKPAKVTDTIKYEAFDADSIEKFGVKKLEITDNNFFGSYRNADLFAVDILTKQADYSPALDLRIKGNLALQLGDIITIGYKYPGDYVITKIANKISNSGGLECNITVKRQQVVEAFILDKSKLDGSDLLG